MRSKYLPWHTAGDKPKKVRCPDCPGSTRDRLEIKRLERKVEHLRKQRDEWHSFATKSTSLRPEPPKICRVLMETNCPGLVHVMQITDTYVTDAGVVVTIAPDSRTPDK
jgi:hypothetical protein